MSDSRNSNSKFMVLECMANIITYVSNALKTFLKMADRSEEEEYDQELYRRCREEFIPNTVCERVNNVEVRWLPKDFSQSKIGSGSSGSNACTLIAVLVALKCHDKDILSTRDLSIDGYESLLYVFCVSIVEGNRIHEDLQRSGLLDDVNLTVPEAIRACGDASARLVEWKSLIYMMEMRNSLFKEMSEKLLEFFDQSIGNKVTQLFVTLITENRTVLFVIQRKINTAVLIDSHQHIPYGAVTARADIQHLEELCLWYDTVLRHHYKLAPNCYELTYLYIDPGPEW